MIESKFVGPAAGVHVTTIEFCPGPADLLGVGSARARGIGFIAYETEPSRSNP